ncbi:TPA: hypothetical protein ACH3X1_013449 [Trebouxia sp. C0004]
MFQPTARGRGSPPGQSSIMAVEQNSNPPRTGGANRIRAPAPTVPGPGPALRPEHTNVAMDPGEVLRQAGVSISREVDFGPALPFTMGTVGSDSEFQDCASPKASASRPMGAFFD